MPDKIQDKRKRLYDALVAADYDAGADFNDFNNLMNTDEVARQWVYDTAKSEGWKVGDNFEQFVGYITPAQKSPTPQVNNEPYEFGKPVYSQAPNHVEGDIYKHGDSYTRTEIPYRTVEYPTLGEAQEAEKAKQREDALAAYRSAYNRLEAPGEVDEKTLIEWGNNMENAPIEQKNLYTRIMGKDAANRVDLDAVMRSYDETRKSLEGVEDPEGLAAYLMMPAEQKAKLPEDERNRYEGLVKDKKKTDAVDDVNELHERISSLMEQQRVSDIKMHRDYLENRSTGQAIKDAILGIPVAEAPQLQGVIPSSGLDLTPEGKLSNEQNAALTAAGRRWNEMKYLINAAQNGNLFDGLDKALGSIDTWTSDQMLRDNMAIMRVANKFDEEGEKSLTDNERALLDALALNVAVSEMYGDEISNWYKGGEMLGEMAPFMLEMLMNPLAGLGKKAADKVTRKAIEKYGKELVKKNAKKFALTRGAAKLGASVAGATGMALTTGLPAVGADIQKRMLGDATYGYDNEGNIEYTGHVGGEGLGTSAYKAVTSRMLDNVSEMLGAEYANLPLKWLQKAGKGTKLLGWIDNLANSKFGKGVSRFAEKTKWNGPIEEFLEEVHVGLINPVLVGDQSWEEFFTKDNLATIAIGVAVPGAAISTANTIAGAADGAFKVGAQERWKMQNAEAMGYQLWQDNPNEWNDLTRSLMEGQMEDVEKALKEVYNNPKLTPEQKKVALEYAVYSLQWRTAQGVKEAFNEGKKFIDPMLRDIYSTAYAEKVSPVQANNAYKAMAEAEKNAQRVLGIGEESVDEWLNGRSAEEATNDAALQEAIKAYQAAKLDFEGRRDRYIAEKERAYMESDKSIQANDNNGMVYATQLKDEPVYITGGNVVLNEDGTIDVDNSSEVLYVKFPDGHVEMTSPDKFTEVFTSDRTADLKAAKRAEIDERWKAEFDAAEAQSVEQEKRDSGVVFDKADAQGNHRIEILNEGEDMSNILFDGAETEIPTEELNRWKQEAGIQSADAVVDNTTDNVAPTGDNVAPVENNEQAPVELPNVPDFFRLGGRNYEVASRNDDGSVDVMVDGKRETLPAGTDYSTHMPTDKKGEVQYEQMPVERTHEYFIQKVKDDEARAEMIEKRRKKAESERKKFDKKPDPGIDPDAYEAKMTQWEADKKAAQAKVDYWNEVAKRDAEITRSETREAVENIKPDVMEETADEFIANQLAGIKITPESFKRETGLSNAEQAQLVGVISNDGVSVERAAEIILENYDSELAGLGFTGDVQDVRDIIIDVLSQGNPRSYAKKGREAREAENMDQQRADAEAWAKGAFDMTLDELYLYEETILPRMMRDYEGFDENEYYSNLAENNGYDTTRESESIGRGGELLQGEQSVPAGGTPVVGQRNEGGAVSDDVQGGGQNGVAQEEVPVNEPVGNSEQLSSSEIPNNQSVAEGDAPGNGGVLLSDEVANAEAEVNTTPTDAQKEAGNYKKGHVKIGPFNISIEQPKGSVRSGVDKDGKKWEVEMQNTYGYFRGTEGVDGDHIDVFLSNDIDGWNGRQVFVVDQCNADGSFDEHKVMLGFNDINDAEAAYMSNYEEGWQGLGAITGVSIEEFEKWISSSHRKTKAFAEYKNVKTDEGQSASADKDLRRKLADQVLARAEEKRRIPLRERARELEAQVGVKANIIESLDEVKNREARKRIAAGEAVAGWYSGGQVYLYMPNIKDRREIELTYVHEVVAHHGVKKLLGERFNEFLDGVWNMMSEADRARMLAYVGANENPTLQDMRAAADEYVAELAEKMNLGELEQSTWEKIVDWFKELLESVGFENLTKEDIESMLKASYANLRSTEQGAESKENDFRARMTFHGSGAQFDRFDNSLGDEDGMSYGWGTYVTSDKAVGKKYAEMRKTRTGRGFLYEVEIPDDNGHNYLDWNAPISDELFNDVLKRFSLEEIKNGLEPLLEEFPQWKNDLGDNATKEDIIRRLMSEIESDSFGAFDAALSTLVGGKNVSKVLNDLGFVGISYPAEAMTGGRADNARNYVIFNENDAEIKDRTMFRISRTPQEFDATQAEAVEKRGIVAPGLNEAVVNVVDVPRHDFTGNLKEARAKAKEWAIENYTGKEFDLPENAGKYVISKNAIGKYLDKSAFDKSENAAVHLSVLKELPNIISNSIEAEIHADYSKGVNGERSAENGVNRNDLLVHRIYGTVDIDGKTYRVKTTIHEFRDANTANTPHSYEVTKIELIEDSTVTPNDGINNPLNRSVNSISATKLLEGVEKSYDKGKKVLVESENSSENDATRFRRSMTKEEARQMVRELVVPFAKELREEQERAQATEDSGTRFRIANENQEIFVSNAQRAVEGIQQNKATAEQWIAMLKKNGGLKAGEDAWLGLEEWLNEKQGAVTKQEILDYIAQNRIQIEEVQYGDDSSVVNDSAFNDAFYVEEDAYGEPLVKVKDARMAIWLYNREYPFRKMSNNIAEITDEEFNELEYFGEEYFKRGIGDVKLIDSTRLEYTTDGLGNKREIALTVPTIEPYNESDEVHFGDAGNGRAVAWVRFGETTDSEGNRVLVIDEIQSKRHQEGREKGYITEEMINAKREYDYLYKKLYRDGLSEEEHERYKWLGEFYKENFGIVPSAPFEKNWHELAMKRMLRLAAEEGFDKVAWTTGEQQAERYNMSKQVERIDVEDNGVEEFSDGTLVAKNVALRTANDNVVHLYVDADGVAHGREFDGKSLAEIVGKELAEKIMQPGDFTIEGDGLRIGGEGMKGFYDKMLPSFVQKYTKKWGAKVGEVTMPSLEENNTMWSVDVTPEMQESVMQGQTMFRKKEKEENIVEESNKNVSLYRTEDGKVLRYEQLDLFDNERTESDIQRGAAGGTETADNRSGTGGVQREDATGRDIDSLNIPLRPLEKGEVSRVQRVFTKSKAFDFTAGERIESLEDVAYIFKNLEDESVENTFAVLVKDERPIILHLGMGHYTASIVNLSAISVAVRNMNPDKIYFVHNHPSGALKASTNDLSVWNALKEAYGDIVEKGIIINLKSGKFGVFDQAESEVRPVKEGNDADIPVELFAFNKQVFDKDYNPEELYQAKSQEDVAAFISSNRLGERSKVGVLVCNPQLRVVGNVFTPFTGITSAGAKKVAEEVVYYTTIMGGTRPILFGNFPTLNRTAKSLLEQYISIYSGGSIKMADIVDIKSGESVINEPEETYGGEERANTGTEGNNRTVVRETLRDINAEAGQERARREAEGAGETRFSTRGEGIDNVPTQPLTLMERITNSLLEVSAKNKENLELRASALRTFGRDINRVLSLMKAQREYDKSTVDTLVKLAKMYFQNAQLLGEVTPYEVARIMGVLNRSVGKRDISTEAAKLMDILLDAHANALAGILDKAEKVKAKKVNAAGVEVMGRLDKYGQKRVDEYRAAKGMTPEKLEEAIYDSDNRLAELEQRVREVLGIPDGDVDLAAREYTGDNDVVNVYMDERARLEGLTLAREYKESIQQVQEEIKDLKKELKQAEEDYRLGNIDGKSLKEFRKSVAEAIMESKAELIEGYHSLIYKFQENTKESSKRAKEFAQAQIDRAREIQHNANSDLEGHPAEAQGETPDKWNSSVPRLFMSAMPTFQTMLKFFGEKAADGRGYLYERFIPQYTQASHNEYVGKTEAREKMRKKLTEIFGKKTSIEKFMDMSRKDGAVLEYQEGGEKKTIDLTRGQVLYLYMINKMADGQMKLSRMGITEDMVAEMTEKLEPQMVQFADWVQEEFLTELREKYNKVHERMFGAPMAAIESYFPIKINKRSRGEKIEPGMNAEDKPSTVTGSVIKRTKNAVAIDLSADAMQVLLGHVDDMENWAAFAEFRRDVKLLLNYRHFQNQVKGMESLRYGSGEKLWKNFVDVANIAAGSFKPSSTTHDRAVRNIAKGVVSSKIAFRYFTAVKQILSTPAFWSEVDFGKMMNAYLHQKEAWDWAMKNLPGFSKRWEGRASGNEILLESDADWKVWQNRAVQWLSKEGMRANAFIDALTVATGAKAVFETKYEMFKKAGYSEERAREKALNRAAEAYNESQQSSESAYLSPLQAEATFVSSVLTAYRNSPFGYNRKMATAIANLKKKMKKGFKQESIEYMTKQLMRDGLNEEQAKKFAKSTYRRSVARDAADVALYGFFLNYVWVLGPSLIYILLGDDDEKKKELHTEALIDGAMGGLGNLPAGETLTGAIKAIAEGDVSNFKLPQAVAMQDIETIADMMQTDPVRAAGEVLNILVAMGVGVNPQTFTDMFVALADTEDWSDPRELAMLVLRLINAPNSKLELLEADEAMENYGANIEEITREFAEYQKSKRAPLSGWLYSDEGEQKAIERYEKRFKKILDERFEVVVENTDEYDMWYENSDPQMKAKLAKMREAYLEGDKKATFEKLDAEELVKKILYGAGYNEVNTVYYELSTAEDEDNAYVLKSVLTELNDLVEEGMQTDEEETLLKDLKGKNNAINIAKRLMKQQPDKAQEHMNNIRKLRAEAMELINNYRKNL